MRPARFADRIENDVDAALVRARPDLLAHIRRRVVEQILRAQSARECELLVAVRRYPHGCADKPHDLERGECDTAPDSPDQDIVGFLYACAGHDHAPGCKRRQGERSRLFDRLVFGDAACVARWNDDVFCQRAGRVLSQQLEVDAERLLAGLAILA